MAFAMRLICSLPAGKFLANRPGGAIISSVEFNPTRQIGKPKKGVIRK
jgi:hypothetical protein